jgi:hypothetical protein
MARGIAAALAETVSPRDGTRPGWVHADKLEGSVWRAIADWNHVNAQLLQRPAHLGQPVLIHRLSSLLSHKEMARPVAKQRAEQSSLLDHCPQPHITVRVDSSSISWA